jgi:hypothetical protein
MANESFRSNYDTNAEVLSRAQKETEEYFQRAAEAPDIDNRGRLNSFFLRQDNGLARNVVTDLGGNFRMPATTEGKPESSESRFRYEWLAKNQLDQREKFSKEDLSERFKDKLPEKAISGKLGDLVKGKAVLQDEAKKGVDREAQQAGQAGQGQPMAQTQQGRLLGSQRELARQYQQQLAAPTVTRGSTITASESGPVNRPGVAAGADSTTRLWDMEQSGEQGGRGIAQSVNGRAIVTNGSAPALALGEGLGYGAGIGGGGFGGGGAGPPVAGFGRAVADYTDQGHLVSLDVQLPVRGQEYFFTTPRGEVRIIARGISQPLASRLIRLLVIAIGAIVVWLAYLVLRRCVPVILRTSAGAALLIVLGLASLVSMTFPLIGLAVLIIGVVQLTWLIIQRRRRPVSVRPPWCIESRGERKHPAP